MSASGPVRRAKDGGKNDWRTPPELFALLKDEFAFTWDGAASDENHLCDSYFTESYDAFHGEPMDERIFVNPPYAGLKKWIALFREWQETYNTVVALVPAAPDTEWWKSAYEVAAEVRLLFGRVRFINPTTGKPDGSNTTGSTVFVFEQSQRPRQIYLWDWRAEL